MNERGPNETGADLAQPGASETRTATPAVPDATEPLAAVRALQYQLNTLLILLFIMSGTLAVHFYVQCRYSGREVRNLREHALPQINQYNTNTLPQVQRFLNDLARYAEQHSDVVPILVRYGLVARREAPAPGATPAPGVAAPPPAAKP